MPRNRLPRVMKHYSPTGWRNHGRRSKILLGTWDRNGSTSGPTPYKIYDDDDDDDKSIWHYVRTKFRKNQTESKNRNGHTLSHMEWSSVDSGVKWPEHKGYGLKFWNLIFAPAVFLRGASRRHPDNRSHKSKENEHVTNVEVTRCADSFTGVGIECWM